MMIKVFTKTECVLYAFIFKLLDHKSTECYEQFIGTKIVIRKTQIFRYPLNK